MTGCGSEHQGRRSVSVSTVQDLDLPVAGDGVMAGRGLTVSLSCGRRVCLGFEQVTALHGPPVKAAVRVNETRCVTTPDGLPHEDAGVLDGELGSHREPSPILLLT